MSIRIVAIGKKHESWVADGILRYQERLRKPHDIEWVLLPHSAYDGLRARQEESDRILSRLGAGDFVILLDERGKMIDSPALSKLFTDQLSSSKQIAIIIGGAYGVDETVHGQADYIWSLSPLVFPHQMVRLILAEQIYRAQEIAGEKPYHHR